MIRPNIYIKKKQYSLKYNDISNLKIEQLKYKESLN